MNKIATTPQMIIVPAWEIWAARFFRGLIVLTAVLHLVYGAWLYALLCLLALGLMTLPPLLARTNQVNVPVEIELLLLWWLVADMTIGRLMGMYQDSIWYDKVIHLGNTGLLGIVAFLAIYTLRMTGRLQTGFILNLAAIFLIALGVGALWEIFEYIADLYFHQGAQGSPLMSPLDDTMWDLILDGFGGIIGGLLGSWYMKKSKRSMIRWRAFAETLAGRSI